MTTLRKILDRIEVKKSDYERYGLSQVEYSAIMTFFDLAQEFDDIVDYYHLCIAIPKSFFNLDARLYIRNIQSNALQLLARTDAKDDNAQILPLEKGGIIPSLAKRGKGRFFNNYAFNYETLNKFPDVP